MWEKICAWFKENKEALFFVLAVIVAIANYFGFKEFELPPEVLTLITILLGWLFPKAAKKAQIL